MSSHRTNKVYSPIYITGWLLWRINLHWVRFRELWVISPTSPPSPGRNITMIRWVILHVHLKYLNFSQVKFVFRYFEISIRSFNTLIGLSLDIISNAWIYSQSQPNQTFLPWNPKTDVPRIQTHYHLSPVPKYLCHPISASKFKKIAAVFDE